MIAIGIVLALLGYFAGEATIDPRIKDWRNESVEAFISILIFVIGMLLIIAGLVVLAWRYLP